MSLFPLATCHLPLPSSPQRCPVFSPVVLPYRSALFFCSSALPSCYRAGKSSFSGPDQIRPWASDFSIASNVICFRQEPRRRRLALTASAGQHFLPALSCPTVLPFCRYAHCPAVLPYRSTPCRVALPSCPSSCPAVPARRRPPPPPPPRRAAPRWTCIIHPV